MMKLTLKRFGWVLTLTCVLTMGMVFGGGLVAFFGPDLTANLVDVAQAQSPDDEVDAGILISKVIADSPAAEAGLKRGNILLQVDDTPVNTVPDLMTYLADLAPDDEITLTFLHGDDTKTAAAILGDRNGRPYLGIVPCGFDHVAVGVMGSAEGPNAEWRFDSMMPNGAIIMSVQDNSPAAEADLQVGDRIVAVDEQALDADHSLVDVIETHQPGDEVELEINRGNDETLKVMVTLGEHPENENAAYLGVSYGPRRMFNLENGPQFFRRNFNRNDLEQFLDQLPDQFKLEDGLSQGAIIRDFSENSPAEDAGLARGDIITALDGEAVASGKALTEMLADYVPGDTVTLTVYHRDDGAERTVEVTLGQHPDNPEAAFLGVQLARFLRFRHEGGLPDTGTLHLFPEPADEGLRLFGMIGSIEEGMLDEAGHLKFSPENFLLDQLPLKEFDFHFFGGEEMFDMSFGDGSL